MAEKFYCDVLLGSWVLTFFLGCYLLITRVPRRETLKNYVRSRRLFGVVFLLVSTNQFLSWLLGYREVNTYMSSSIDISFYLPIMILFLMAFAYLLDETYISKRRVLLDGIIFMTVQIVLWPIGLNTTEAVQNNILYSVIAFFGLYFVHLVFCLLSIYKATIRRMKEYSSEDNEKHINWIHRGFWLSITLGIGSIIIIPASYIMNAVYAILIVLFAVYLFYSLLNHLINYESVERSIVQPEEEGILIAGETSLLIKDELEQWVADRGYCTPGLTIDGLARHIGTNRSYISAYINSYCGCTFCAWINAKRLDYAKSLLLSDKNFGMESIAQLSGFSSASYFIRIFKRDMKCSPAKWRDENTSHCR